MVAMLIGELMAPAIHTQIPVNTFVRHDGTQQEKQKRQAAMQHPRTYIILHFSIQSTEVALQNNKRLQQGAIRTASPL